MLMKFTSGLKDGVIFSAVVGLKKFSRKLNPNRIDQLTKAHTERWTRAEWAL